ncbi:MAG TPA: biotin/lipoyl-containing protein, partial [Burkholderiaceae bacterium]|nr:biotin/lipoyl-containing protein [Burkholderiaceae bacterium]
MSTIELNVPDIGDFAEVEVIEVLVAPGDTVKQEQSLITVESDKASMEIPAAAAGVVKAVLVKVGDKVTEGSAIVQLETSDAAQPAASGQTGGPQAGARETGTEPPREQAKVAAQFDGAASAEYDVVVLGAGPGGYSAAFRAADLGLKVALVERYSTLGGVCLNVGCIPSKALLHTAAVLEEAQSLAAHGIAFGKPDINLDGLRAYKDSVVAKLTGGLAGMAKARKVSVLTGVGQFVDPQHLSVQGQDGQTQTIRFGSAIIAAGSQS